MLEVFAVSEAFEAFGRSRHCCEALEAREAFEAFQVLETFKTFEAFEAIDVFEVFEAFEAFERSRRWKCSRPLASGDGLANKRQPAANFNKRVSFRKKATSTNPFVHSTGERLQPAMDSATFVQFCRSPCMLCLPCSKHSIHLRLSRHWWCLKRSKRLKGSRRSKRSSVRGARSIRGV